MRTLILPAIAATSILAVLAFTSAAQAGDFEISAYGGFQTAPHSEVHVSDQPDFTAKWEGKSFSTPPYYGIRGTYWFDQGSLKNWGISLDYTHAKVYADSDTKAEAGWSTFEFTDGLNLLTVNALHKWQFEGSGWEPYVGIGAGINVPHVEVERASGRTFEYQVGGAALQAQAGVRYQFTESWSAFAEYKGNYSFVNVDIDSGANLKTDVITNAINFGVSYKF